VSVILEGPLFFWGGEQHENQRSSRACCRFANPLIISDVLRKFAKKLRHRAENEGISMAFSLPHFMLTRVSG